eukprot:scaffold112097_cov36-Phaeocystis_antarctica.AAC.1
MARCVHGMCVRVHVCTEWSNEASAESTAAARLITTKAAQLASERARPLPSRPAEEGASVNKVSFMTSSSLAVDVLSVADKFGGI